MPILTPQSHSHSAHTFRVKGVAYTTVRRVRYLVYATSWPKATEACVLESILKVEAKFSVQPNRWQHHAAAQKTPPYNLHYSQ